MIATTPRAKGQNQATATPWEFFQAVDPAQDSLAQPWHRLQGWSWLNPPFAAIEPWAAKCAAAMMLGARIVMLVPASVGSNWFGRHVLGIAEVQFLAPRIKFEGHAQPYPKDCMLCVYELGRDPRLWQRRWDRRPEPSELTLFHPEPSRHPELSRTQGPGKLPPPHPLCGKGARPYTQGVKTIDQGGSK